jgi:UDP-N-acetylglucosamine transferase subunit ALG13
VSSRLRLVPFFDGDELERLYGEASLVICQAGVGSIMMGLRKRKKLIAIARRCSLGEHIDDHQLEILKVFSRLGTVLEWNGEGDLPDVLERARTFNAAPYVFAEERISDAILAYLTGQGAQHGAGAAGPS